MQEQGAASPPSGYVMFCSGAEGPCAQDRMPGGVPRAVDARGLAALARINRQVNAAIAPRPDPADLWRADAAEGDCEDYALAKRALLLRRGWRPSQLLLAVADADGAPHAVLIARTTLGDFVLDNLTDDVLRWDRAAVTVRARQSARLPALWVAVAAAPPGVVSPPRRPPIRR